MECIRCGRPANQEQTVCEGCGLDLTTLEHGTDGRVHPVYELYLSLRRACDAAVAGTQSSAEFAAFVQATSEKMEARERGIREVEIPPEVFDSIREELEAGFRGLALYNEAMAMLRDYVANPSSERMRAALDKAWEGNESINLARRLNRQQRDLQDAPTS